MTPAFRNVLILVLALIAGIVTQEVVQKFTVANDEPEQAAVACPDPACPPEYVDSNAEPQRAEPPASNLFLVAASPEAALPSVAADNPQGQAETAAETNGAPPDPAPAPPDSQSQPPAAKTTAWPETVTPSVPHPEPAKSEIRIVPPPSTEKLLVDKTEAAASDAKPPLSASPAERRSTPRQPKHSASPNASASAAFAAGRLSAPQELVRERAIARDVERRKRIEFRKSLGFMPLRPTVSANVHMGGAYTNPTMFFLPYVVTERRGEPSLGARYLDSLRRD